MNRTEICRSVRDAVQQAFPKARVTTNDDMNPATPIAVTAEWSTPSLHKVIRAQKLDVTPEGFAADAIRQLDTFYRARRGGATLPQ